MTMGTNEQEHPRARTRKTKRDAVIEALTGMVSALLFVMALPTADNWFRILGTCLLAIGAVVYVAKAIITLRQDDHAPPE
ncbi:hypothetical protein V6S67_19365 [Arthrobacter sp. Soc17.1.1.1]|uniref:hypothetical protein n=1 Tax=Arthrobacter sp. Soc17.1.1.1 TaxID=3121277 RepID=UPI002FE46DD2